MSAQTQAATTVELPSIAKAGGEYPNLTSNTPLQRGQTVVNGAYTIRRVLSISTMATVYLATDHIAHNRDVVIKAIRQSPKSGDSSHQSPPYTLREAVMLASLRHPTLPHLLTTFRDSQAAYIVMEYVNGPNLEQGLTHIDDITGSLVEGQSYRIEDVRRWGIALCRTLEYLTNRRPQPVIHRDIKPANIVIDRAADTICLVDFGTAKGGVLANTSQHPWPYHSHRHGTIGYAPPEQYRGQSDERSDIYALAATLYHLATDDDPRNHPFRFPRLSELGAFGEALRPALAQDITQRPTITEFRQRLEAVLGTTRLPYIRTPNNACVTSERTLAIWCKRHWEEACDWLYDTLPDQVALWWGDQELAQSMRYIVSKEADRNAGLDTILARLDPKGYGAQAPQLSTSTQQLDFACKNRSQLRHTLAFKNTGRRYITAKLQQPDWLCASPQSIQLFPGQEATVELSYNPSALVDTQHSSDYLTFRSHTTTLLRIIVKATHPCTNHIWRHVPLAWIAGAATIALTMLSMSAWSF
ncbi:MAG: serine/threonine-protein kinase [Chloroflexota bacterium]